MNELNLITFYGGTFDPIHYGHIYSATSLARLIRLKEIVLLPNNIPPHRPLPIASAKQRLDMLRLAISELFGVVVFTLDDREMRRSTPSWTVEVFEDLRYREYGPDVPLGFIIGQDSLPNLPKWHRGLTLPNLCHLLVCSRPGFNNKINSKKNFWFTERLTNNPDKLYQQPSGLIYIASTTKIAISASEIRERYRKGLDCNGLLPLSVQYYINLEGLYR